MTDRAVADVAAPTRAHREHRSRGRRASTADDPTWWRSAVIYQIYVRSFADGNGDGTGDLAGVRSRLPYLRDLGVDAIWFTPWYVSPLADGGYDVADYRAIDPAFGTLDEAEALIAEALELGIRTIIDIVPNHVSDRAPVVPGGARRRARLARARALLVPPGPRRRRRRAADRLGLELRGRRPGPARPNPDGTPGEWYLHLFTPEQPDLNWDHPDVRAEHEDILRFWFDRGVAGVRIDSAALLVKDPTLPEVPDDPGPATTRPRTATSCTTIYRALAARRRLLPGHARARRRALARRTSTGSRSYLRPDELHTAFNFDFMARPWDAAEPARRRSTRPSPPTRRSARRRPGCSRNHDVTRPVTRYGREDTSFAFARKRFGTPDRPRARQPPGPGRGPAHRGPARLALHLPGRRARPARSRTSARA